MIVFTFDPWQIVQLVVATILPILVGLVTTRATSGGVKAVLLAGLAVLSSIGTELLDAHAVGDPFDIGQSLVIGLGSFIVAVAMHYGLWKPVGASELVQDVGTTSDPDH